MGHETILKPPRGRPMQNATVINDNKNKHLTTVFALFSNAVAFDVAMESQK